MSRWTFFSLYVGLHVPGWLNVLGRLPVVTCDFEPPEHAPRTSAGAHTCAVVFGWAPGVWSREHEKRPAARREKNDDVQSNTFIHGNYVYILYMYYVACE